jgi:hypothetical protein
MSNYIVTPEQVERVVQQEDIEFVKKYREIYGNYPTYRGLQFGNHTVGEVHPEHPMRDLKWATYVGKLGKLFTPIVMLASKEKDEELADFKNRGNRYKSLDNKHLFQSKLAAFTYNIFLLEDVAQEMELESRKFLSTCGKIPDFIWGNKKLVIEVAGMESENYLSKLESAKTCFSNLGYKVVILDSRLFEKANKFVDYYLYVCKTFGFEPKKEVLESPYKYLGFTQLMKKDLQKYIDDNIGRYNELDRKGQYNLNKYIQQLYGINVRQYKNKMGIKRYVKSKSKQHIIDFKKENPQMSNQEIANHFGVSKNTIQTATSGMPGRKF